MSIISVFVNNIVDSSPNKTACDPSISIQDECNLRSAMEFCGSVLIESDVACVVNLPAMENIYIDPKLEEMSLIRPQGALYIIGNGCRFLPLQNSDRSGRLFVIKDVTVLREFTFYMSNATIEGMGSFSEDGGAMKFFDVSVVMDSIIFKNNVASEGGAIYFNNCFDVILKSLEFLSNTAALGGGAITLDQHNERVNISDCNFIRNEAGESGISDAAGRKLFTISVLETIYIYIIYIYIICSFYLLVEMKFSY